MFDAAEYIHLAMHASKKGDSHAALTYLKEALLMEPESATAHYLMAAEHAEIGLSQRAIDGMTNTLRLDPGLDIARFQLGLLYLQSGDISSANECFTHLTSTAKDESLIAFSKAYIHLAEEKVGDAIHAIREGLSGCTNAHLKSDMERVLDSLHSQPTAHTDVSSSSDAKHGSKLMLAAYRDSIEPH